MSERFCGDWTVEVAWGGIWDAALVVDRSRRFIIDGALTGNGAHPVNLGPAAPTPVSVSGSSWFIWIELYGVAGWQPEANQKRRSAAYTLQGGLVVELTSGNWLTPPPDAAPFVQSGDSAALRCRNDDSKLSPWPDPFVNSYDFAMPPRRRRPVRPAIPPIG
ncbi:MAG: hypothetical protein ABI862_02660 [Ilumatobacteraceae bacterium]